MNKRITSLYATLEKEQLDGLIISSNANISYLTGFEARDAYALISKQGNYYFTDSRYTEEVKHKLKDFHLKIIDSSVFKLIADTAAALKLKLVGFEERIIPFAEYEKIKLCMGKRCEMAPINSLIEELRQVKDDTELALIKKAVSITEEAYRFIQKQILPGRTELEIAGELERFIRYQGASKASFEIIVGSGPNASCPHHLTSSRKIQKDEPVLIDMGVDYAGYKSDLTRVFFSGKIKVFCKKIYSIVKEAQDRAIKAIKPGIRLSLIDQAGRNYITNRGYGAYFGHNLGHGIGLEVHEAPHISPKTEDTLKPGMVFTIEPGIYLPGRFGIRIEDMILVTRKGVEILSGSLNK